MNFIGNRNFRAGPQTSLEGFICHQNSDKPQKIKVFGRSGGVFLLSLTFLLKKQSDVFIPYYEMAYRLLMMPLACLAMECLKTKRFNLLLRWFGRYSLEIYVLQMLVIGVAQKVLEAMHCPLSLIPVLHTLLTFAIVIGFCVPIHNGIDKLINKIK